MTLWIQFFHHFLSAFILGGIYYGTGNTADNPFMNFKFSLSVLVFFMYTYIMTPVLLCKYSGHTLCSFHYFMSLIVNPSVW